ncbi:MAG TPA: hypothetical protein P5119_03620 [Candidatus Aminicenantes bacterium]|nr:hypothetical protein [Candidatus Aminicenantes bacterium]HRY64411.1 hypothetical protein [Candidatus Aminicenantes bacterium]HRZ71324.1 hypothetical protein [Candidatus Aminicenantes bacterium]
MRPLSFLSPVVRPGQPGLTFSLPLLAAVLALSGCGGRVYVVSSLGPPHSITVDGETDDWNGALSYVEKNRLFVGFVNNRDALYVCLTREDIEGRASGAPIGDLTVWIDPQGGSRKTLGIRLTQAGGPPAGGRPGGERPEGEPGGEPEQGGRRPERRPGREPEGENAGPGQDRPAGPPGGTVEILGPNGRTLQKLSAEEAAAAGLEVKTGISAGSFTVEIGIPLRADDGHPYAVGVEPGGTLGIGFVSAAASRDGRRDGPPGGAPGGGGGMPGGMPGGMGGMPGGMGGPGGGMGGPGGGMRPDMDPDVAKSFKIWARVRLADSSRPQTAESLEIQ